MTSYPTYLLKYKPAVSKFWLYFTAGLIWLGVGLMLDNLASGWLRRFDFPSILPFIAAGLALAFLIYRFGFSRLAEKNILRISKYRAHKVCFFAFQTWTSYPLVAFMIFLGIFLRTYSPIPKPYLAIGYIGIGTALFLASLHYFIKITSRRQS